MREILFRGKRPITKDWVYGTGLLFDSINIWIVGNSSLKAIAFGEEQYIVIPETVGQYTGLTDKNGTKIFEGDILQTTTIDTNEDVKALVGFGEFVDENNDDEYLGFYIEFSGIKTTITQLLGEDTKDDFDIVGNIHDNPELLGGDN